MENTQNVFEHLVVVKRSGQRVSFNGAKIAVAIKLAFDDVYENANERDINKVYNAVLEYIDTVYQDRKTISVEAIQDIIENTLKKLGFNDVFNSFNQYRLRRTTSREVFSVKEQHKFVKAIEKIGLTVKSCKENKPLDLIFNFGKTISREFSGAYLLETKYLRAHEEGLICIDGLDAYALAITDSSHLNLSNISGRNLFDFTHNIVTVLTHFKEEQYGEHTLSDLDKVYQPVILKEFKQNLIENFFYILSLEGVAEYFPESEFCSKVELATTMDDLVNLGEILKNERLKTLYKQTYIFTNDKLLDAIDSNINYLLTTISGFHFRLAKNRVNISLGGANTKESQMFVDEYFKVLTHSSFKNINTIFKYSNSIAAKTEEYLVSALLNGVKITLLYLDNNDIEDGVEVFSDGVIIDKNINSDDNTCQGRMILSKTAINLARLGYKYCYDQMDDFYSELTDLMELTKNQLMQRYEHQANKYKDGFDYIFEDDVLFESRKLEANQKVRKILRHGVLNISFVGIVECVESLLKKDTLEAKDWNVVKDIITFMQKKVEEYSRDNKLNFILSEESDFKISQNLLGIDKALYGENSLLKKAHYALFSEVLKSLPQEKYLNACNELMHLTNFNCEVYLPKNSGRKRVMDLLELGKKSGVKFVKVQVGR